VTINNSTFTTTEYHVFIQQLWYFHNILITEMRYLWTFQNELFASILSTSIIFSELCFQFLKLRNLYINL